MKLLREYYKEILYIILLIILLSIIVPLLLEYVVYRNHFDSTISNSDISSFLGSFLGALIGAGITLITMYVSISETRKDLRREECIKNRSYIDTFAKKSESGTLKEVKDYYKKAKIIVDNEYIRILDSPALIAKNNGIVFLGIQNCGDAIIREVRVDVINENNNKCFFINRILTNEIFFIPIVYKKYEEAKCFIKYLTLTYKTLSNEVVIMNKKFDKNLSYSENIEVYGAWEYNYDSKQCIWMDIENLNW